jgi:hypothetical protein
MSSCTRRIVVRGRRGVQRFAGCCVRPPRRVKADRESGKGLSLDLPKDFELPDDLMNPSCRPASAESSERAHLRDR